MHSENGNIKYISYGDPMMFNSRRSKYQDGLETSMKGRDFKLKFS